MDGSKEILTPRNLDGKMGIDNGMVMGRRTSTGQSPHHAKTENVYDKEGSLNTVHVSNSRRTSRKSQDADKYYEPYDNRIVAHPTTFRETLIHMLKASLGIGVLAMPGSFKDAGWFIGIVGLLFSGAICIHSMHIVIGSEYELCKRRKKPCMSYSETFQAAVEEGPRSTRWLSKYVPHFVNLLLFIYQAGTCSVYVSFIASNLKDITDDYLDIKWSTTWYKIALLVPLILINWVRNLKLLAPFSTFANGLTVCSFTIIFWYLFRGLPSLADRTAVGPIGKLPIFFSTVLFAMEAIGAVMPLENEMKNPRRFGGTFGVLNLAMVPILCLYLSLGFFGYLRYGEDLKETLTLSLPQSEGLAQTAKGMMAMSILITHSLIAYIGFDIVFNEYIHPKTGDNILIEYTVRTCLVLMNVVGAIVIPYLDLFISLVGAVCLSTMGLMIPPLVQLFTFWYEYRGTEFALLACKNGFMISVGLFAFFSGSYSSMGAIIQKFKDEP